ncbi:hypothetical protein TNCV_454551 [Trichonephila clavipes]|nr:hypothetical protein TNCV_454551 [Trichonephila clavipes]
MQYKNDAYANVRNKRHMRRVYAKRVWSARTAEDYNKRKNGGAMKDIRCKSKRKESDCSAVQQKDNKCRCLLGSGGFNKGGAFTRRPERCISLKVGHRWLRLDWCNEHKNWTSHPSNIRERDAYGASGVAVC